ncbi:MAG TPA: helix-turn-helix transcriptional regulator [Syntrophomonadaceae bacterium]|jgi:transcriptional regulator with XRE-family HTH domain|nr:helix-turn-helix transcriptional regulator [Syntrophomonadaceae bacterium]
MLGQRLRNLRTLHGMSQHKLADELSKRIGKELSGDAIGSYERGERRITNDILEGLADIFNCSIDYLVGRSDVEEIQDDEFTTAIAAMFRAQQTLSSEEKKRLVTVLRAGWPDLFRGEDDDN